MKKYFPFLMLFCCTQMLMAQGVQIWKNGRYQEYGLGDIDSVVFYKAPAYVPVESIEVVEMNLEVRVNETVAIHAYALPKNATVQTLKYVTSNKKVATVDANGVVTGVAPGKAIIVVKTTDTESSAKSLSCNIIVVENSDRTPDGVKAIDLGLPSGTLWANCNVGASSSVGAGTFFAWGDPWEKNEYTISNYSQYKATENVSATSKGYIKYVSLADAEDLGRNDYSDNRTVLTPGDDPAFVKWGGDWHTPTKEQMEELVRKCKWTNSGGIFKVTGPNGSSIDLPVCGYKLDDVLYSGSGYYWTSTLSKSHSFSAYVLFLYTNNTISIFGCGRSVGCCVRPVKDQQ